MRALGEQFGVVEGSSVANLGDQGCPNKKVWHWWLRGAMCLAMTALGEQFGYDDGSSEAKMRS